MLLEIPQALAAQLAREAERCGMFTEQHALGILKARLGPRPRLCMGAEVLPFYRREGIIGAWPDIEANGGQARTVRFKAKGRAWSKAPLGAPGSDLQ